MDFNDVLRQIRLDVGDVAAELALCTIQYVGELEANLICNHEHLKIEIIGDVDVVFPFIHHRYISSVLNSLVARDDFEVSTTTQYDPMFPLNRVRKQSAIEIKTQNVGLTRTSVFSDEDIKQTFLEASRFVENSSVAGTIGEIVDSDGNGIPYDDASYVALNYPSNLIHLPRYITNFFLCYQRSARYGNIAEIDEDLTIDIGDVITLVESKKLKIADYWIRQAESFYAAYKRDGKGGGGDNPIENPIVAGQFFNVQDISIDRPSSYKINYHDLLGE